MLPNPRPYFQDLKDPRRETKNKLHKLSDIVMIVLCAVLSGIEDWVGMEAFAEEKEAWLRGFLELPNDIPSHDTLSNVLDEAATRRNSLIARLFIKCNLKPSLRGAILRRIMRLHINDGII
jgi:hypothetical protein